MVMEIELIPFRSYIIPLKILFQGRTRRKIKRNRRKRKERLRGQSRCNCISTHIILINQE